MKLPPWYNTDIPQRTEINSYVHATREEWDSVNSPQNKACFITEQGLIFGVKRQYIKEENNNAEVI